MFLVDGSWSVGRNNFKYILDFIGALVSAFDIGEEKTRVGVVQYSSDTRTEFNLNQYYQRDELLAAIKRIPYKGGNTMTGMILQILLLLKINEIAVWERNCALHNFNMLNNLENNHMVFDFGKIL